MPNIGPMELIIVLVIVLLVFGAKRVPELGRALGSGMRNFKDSVTGKDDGEEEKPARPQIGSTDGTRADAAESADRPGEAVAEPRR